MKKKLTTAIIIVMLTTFIGRDAIAQVNTAPQQRSSIKWTKRMAEDDPALYHSYRKASRMSGAGIGLMAGGFVAMVYGLSIADQSTESTPYGTTVRFSGEGVGIAAIGTLAFFAGMPLMVVGQINKGKYKRRYLREYEYAALPPAAPTPYWALQPSSTGGIGFTLTF